MQGDLKNRPLFIVDRMLGTLGRYLRFMGYDTASATSFREGNTREDTLLLRKAIQEGRVLLTRDRELARRGKGIAVLVRDEQVILQVHQLTEMGLIEPELRMTRCSLCNELLRPAKGHEIEHAEYAPEHREDLAFFWCRNCRKLYWMGSHGRSLSRRLKEGQRPEAGVIKRD